MIVVDTSIVYKWFAKEEPSYTLARELLALHLEDKEKLIAPDLLLYELANAWITKTKIPLEQAKLNLQRVRQFDIQIHNHNGSFIEKTMNFAKDYRVTVYDASYAVLAKEKRCILITADLKFVQQVDLPYVKSLEQYQRK